MAAEGGRPLWGSSPLARGGQRRAGNVAVGQGLIPAGAGRTSGRAARVPLSRAHPRWRGADSFLQSQRFLSWGSSPLARGGLPVHPLQAVTTGLIPAGAGRTLSRPETSRGFGAHPRWRGADQHSLVTTCHDPGSSPLARGGLVLRVARPLADGLIPAGAGRTAAEPAYASHIRAHPRWRGADCLGGVQTNRGVGSSPLARGGRRSSDHRRDGRGLIPAGAGRTCRPMPIHDGSGAHPRWRGADRCSGRKRPSSGGSSPLARGGPSILDWQEKLCGLIPAGAGRTAQGNSASTQGRAHPRWRGADPFAPMLHSMGRGSSPLARGGPFVRRAGHW